MTMEKYVFGITKNFQFTAKFKERAELFGDFSYFYLQKYGFVV